MRGVGSANRVDADFRKADVPDLPRGNQLGQRSDRLLDRGVTVEAVLEVKVDVVGGQPSQGAVDGDADVVGAAVEAFV
jgi:hypothetical protein